MATLAYLTLFNKRRSGETSHIKIMIVKELEEDLWKREDEVNGIEDPVLRQHAKQMHLAYIKGYILILSLLVGT
jgi:hypothetical protein